MTSALEGIKVVEITTMAAAPMASRLLGDWGAEVIHIEHPVTGDPWRTWIGKDLPPKLQYHWWENYARNKKSLSLNIKHEKGRAILDRLLGTADVFLTNRRPFELAELGLEYDDVSRLNPRIIYASLTGFGRKGPDKDMPAHDTVGFWARSGFLHLLQEDGAYPPASGYRTVAAGDKLTALGLACGVAIALYAREKTGVGQEVDVSLLHTAIYALAPTVLTLGGIRDHLATDEARERMWRRSREEASPVTIAYRTKDERYLQLSMAPVEPYWQRFCRAINRPDLEEDARFTSAEARIESRDVLRGILEEIFKTKSLAEWRPLLNEARLLWAPIQTPAEVIEDPQVMASGIIVPFEHPELGPIDVVANPVTLSKTPATIRTTAPEFSEHTEEILLACGYSWEDIARLKEDGVIA